MAALLAAGLCPFAVRAQQAVVPAVNPADRNAVLALYRGYYQTSEGVPPAWTGNVAAGTPGAVGFAYELATLRRINYYRAMSGLPGNVVLDPASSAKCQQAALMMAAEGNVSHYPARSWRGYTPAAAEAAAHCDLALDTCGDEGPGAIDRYIADDGSTNASAGHRRWLLYAGTNRMGLGIVPPAPGSHPGTNATWVCNDGRSPAAQSGAHPAVAWPPAGYVPAPLVYRRWSFSYPDADFSHAVVRVTKNGAPVAVVLEPLGCQSRINGTGVSAGDNTLVWTLPGNAVARTADESYQVSVENVVTAGGVRGFNYPVTSIPVDGARGPSAPNLLAYTVAKTRRKG